MPQTDPSTPGPLPTPAPSSAPLAAPTSGLTPPSEPTGLGSSDPGFPPGLAPASDPGLAPGLGLASEPGFAPGPGLASEPGFAAGPGLASEPGHASGLGLVPESGPTSDAAPGTVPMSVSGQGELPSRLPARRPGASKANPQGGSLVPAENERTDRPAERSSDGERPGTGDTTTGQDPREQPADRSPEVGDETADTRSGPGAADSPEPATPDGPSGATTGPPTADPGSALAEDSGGASAEGSGGASAEAAGEGGSGAVDDEASVGRIAGLRPRRRPGDGGEVRGVDVDLVDGLAPASRHAVTAWLRDGPAAATRQVRLQVLAAFLRWLDSVEPAVEPLAVTGAHLDDYCAAALSGTLTIGVRRPGRPLSNTTVSRKRAVLSSFYRFAWRHGLVQHDQAIDHQPGDARDGRLLTRQDRRLLRKGIARLAADGRHAEAAAVALLEATGAPVDALASLTTQDLRGVVASGMEGPAIITVHDSRGDIVAFPVPPLARPLLRVLSEGRTAGELLISRGDGHPVDVQWLRAALTSAALVGGIPRQRAELLHPYMMRATTVAELLRDRAASAGGGMQPPSGMTALVGRNGPR